MVASQNALASFPVLPKRNWKGNHRFRLHSFYGAGHMAHLIKCLPPKKEELSTHIKCLWLHVSVTLELEWQGQREVDPQSALAIQASQSMRAGLILSPKIRQRAVEEDNQPLHAYSHEHTTVYTHMNTHICIHTHKEAERGGYTIGTSHT